METCCIQEKEDDHLSASQKRSGFMQLLVSDGFTKYGNTLYHPVIRTLFFPWSPQSCGT